MSRTIDVANILRRVHMPADREYLMEIETDGTPETTGLFKTPQGNDLVSTETGWTMTGALAVPDGITGDITGDITGNVSGDLTGNVTGDVSGNVTGNVTGDVTGDLAGTTTGHHIGPVTVPDVEYDPDDPQLPVILGGITATGDAYAKTITLGADLADPDFSVDADGNVAALSVTADSLAASDVAVGSSVATVSYMVESTDETPVPQALLDADGLTLQSDLGALTAAVTRDGQVVCTTGMGVVAASYDPAAPDFAEMVAYFTSDGDCVADKMVRKESEFRSCIMQPDNIAGTEWARGTGSPIYVLGASQTDKILWGYVTEPEGRICTGWKAGGGYTDADASITCTVQLFSYPAGVETAVGAAVSFTPADGRWTAAETLAEPVTLAANTVYALKITATTAVGDELTCDYCRIAARG